MSEPPNPKFDICPTCDRPVIGDDTRAAGLFGEKTCNPQTCTEWQTVGLSRNGGPLLQIVKN